METNKPVIYINISSSFLMRARCKKCGQGPSFYYFIRNPFLWEDVREYLEVSKQSRHNIGRINHDWYLDANPKQFRGITTFSFNVEDKHYLPTLHRVRGAAVNGYTDIYSCDCYYTLWASNKLTKSRPEITNRRGRYSYPQGFE